MTLKNKKVLITAGPTWVAIDKVRVISNVASGTTGILLAKEADRLGCKVTLILGPVGEADLKKAIKIKRFHYFDELHSLIRRELRTKKYDVVIHSAAVSDYKPKQLFFGKIKSSTKGLSLELEKTIKIVDKIKKYGPRVLLTIFKLELGLSKKEMLRRARGTMKIAKADLAVVNTFSKQSPYKALAIDKRRVFFMVSSKQALAKKLLSLISAKIN